MILDLAPHSHSVSVFWTCGRVSQKCGSDLLRYYVVDCFEVPYWYRAIVQTSVCTIALSNFLIWNDPEMTSELKILNCNSAFIIEETSLYDRRRLEDGSAIDFSNSGPVTHKCIKSKSYQPVLSNLWISNFILYYKTYQFFSISGHVTHKWGHSSKFRIVAAPSFSKLWIWKFGG